MGFVYFVIFACMFTVCMYIGITLFSACFVFVDNV